VSGSPYVWWTNDSPRILPALRSPRLVSAVDGRNKCWIRSQPSTSWTLSLQAVMTLPDAERLLDRLIDQIRPDIRPESALVGIHTGGVWIAQRLHIALGLRLPMGTIDVAFYRDDYKQKGLASAVRPSDIPFSVENAHIILVDDVLYTG